MFRAQIIGNLGADAHVESNNGRPFVSFNVAHNDSYVREDGTKVEKSQWISCALNGDGGNLLQYLKKGKQVYVEGRCSTRVFSSEKERRMVAGVNLSVDHIELIGAAVDVVPSRLFDNNGLMPNVNKSYWIDNNEAAVILNGQNAATLMTQSGQQFLLQSPCWVSPMPTEQSEQNQPGEQQVEVFDGSSENDNSTQILQEKMRNAKSKKSK